MTLVKKLFIYMAFALAGLFYLAHALADDVPQYKRSDYKHWSDLDGDGLDTRQEVLIRDSLVPVEFNDKGEVVKGLWSDPYTGFISTSPKDFDLEHAYALKDAHLAGAWELSPKEKEKFANDERHLYMTWKGSNRYKGARNLLEYWPSDLSFLTRYVNARRVMIDEYGLTPPFCEALGMEHFKGYGEFFKRGVKILKIRDWIRENKHIFEHPCFQYKAD